jgi:hypothetical protein
VGYGRILGRSGEVEPWFDASGLRRAGSHYGRDAGAGPQESVHGDIVATANQTRCQARRHHGVRPSAESYPAATRTTRRAVSTTAGWVARNELWNRYWFNLWWFSCWWCYIP